MGDLVLYSASDSLWLQKHPVLGLDIMQHVYNRLDAKYPGLWAQAFSSPEAIADWKATWAEAFDDAKLTPADVVSGLKCVSTLYPDYPPKEGQFVKCCRHIDPFEAYSEALEQMRRRETGADAWSRPAVYWAAIRFGTGDLRHSSWAKVEARWTRLLDDVMTHGPFDPVPPASRAALAAPVAKPEVVGDAAKMRLAQLRAMMGRPSPKRRKGVGVGPVASDAEIEAELALVRQRMGGVKK